jgi:hypothetical protein
VKALLSVSAAAETATGLALLALPSLVASLLLGASLDTPAGLVVARVTGAALLALGVACWLARHDEQGRAAKGLTAALLLYNIAVAAVLAHAGTGVKLFGVGLWPTVVLHVVLAAWCTAFLWTTRANTPGSWTKVQ